MLIKCPNLTNWCIIKYKDGYNLTSKSAVFSLKQSTNMPVFFVYFTSENVKIDTIKR